MKALFLSTFLIVSLTVSTFSQIKINNSFDLESLSMLGDTVYVDQFSGLEIEDRIDRLENLADNFFENYEYKKVIFVSSHLQQLNAQRDSIEIFQDWFRLTHAYHELGIPDSVLRFGIPLLAEMNKDILLYQSQIAKVLERVVLSLMDKLQYDLAFEWINIIELHIKLLGLEKSEMFAEVLYVRCIIMAIQIMDDQIFEILEEIVKIVESQNDYDKNISLRAHALSIRAGIFFQNFSNIQSHIDLFKKKSNDISIVDTATIVSFLMNLSYYHLVKEEYEEMQKVTRVAIGLADKCKKVPSLKAKVRLFEASNRTDRGEHIEAIEILKISRSNSSDNIFFENSFTDLKGLINNLMVEISFSAYLQNGELEYLKYSVEYIIEFLEYLKIKFSDGNVSSSNFSLSKEEMEYYFNQNIIVLSEYIKEVQPADSLTLVYEIFEDYKGFILNYQHRQSLVNSNDSIDVLVNQEKELTFSIKKILRELSIDNISNEEKYQLLLGLQSLRQKVFAIKNKVDNLSKLLIGNAVNDSNNSVEEIIELARSENLSILDYFIYEDQLFTLVITPEKSKLHIQNISLDSLKFEVSHIKSIVENPLSEIDELYINSTIHIHNLLTR